MCTVCQECQSTCSFLISAKHTVSGKSGATAANSNCSSIDPVAVSDVSANWWIGEVAYVILDVQHDWVVAFIENLPHVEVI